MACQKSLAVITELGWSCRIVQSRDPRSTLRLPRESSLKTISGKELTVPASKRAHA